MTAGSAVLASAPVTDWPERMALTLAVAALLGLVLALMRWGWVRRGRRQSFIAPLPAVPELPEVPREASPSPADYVSAVPARYLGATRAGDWLDRVVVHGLGVPSAAQVTVAPGGLWVLRAGAPDIFVAPGDVVAARHDRGTAGRVFESDGVLVITWRHGGQLIDLGMRVRDPDAAESVRAAVARLAVTAEPVTAEPLTAEPVTAEPATEPSVSTSTPGDLA